MARTTQINGVDNVYLSADWADELEPAGLDGYRAVNRYRSLALRGGVMPAATFDALEALAGQVVSVTVPPYADRNADYVTYYGAVLVSVTGQHEGPNVVNVVAELKVTV